MTGAYVRRLFKLLGKGSCQPADWLRRKAKPGTRNFQNIIRFLDRPE